MKVEELQKFLRFTTGSSVLIGKHISVVFNSLSVLARRPIAYTCDCILELLSSYLSYADFKDEFTAVLADTEYNWWMDTI